MDSESRWKLPLDGFRLLLPCLQPQLPVLIAAFPICKSVRAQRGSSGVIDLVMRSWRSAVKGTISGRNRLYKRQMPHCLGRKLAWREGFRLYQGRRETGEGCGLLDHSFGWIWGKTRLWQSKANFSFLYTEMSWKEVANSTITGNKTIIWQFQHNSRRKDKKTAVETKFPPFQPKQSYF